MSVSLQIPQRNQRKIPVREPDEMSTIGQLIRLPKRLSDRLRKKNLGFERKILSFHQRRVA